MADLCCTVHSSSAQARGLPSKLFSLSPGVWHHHHLNHLKACSYLTLTKIILFQIDSMQHGSGAIYISRDTSYVMMHKRSNLPGYCQSQTASVASAAVDPGMVDGQDAPQEPGRILLWGDSWCWGGQGNPPVEPRWPAEPRGPQMTRMTLVITPNTSSRPAMPTSPPELTRPHCHLHLTIQARQESAV